MQMDTNQPVDPAQPQPLVQHLVMMANGEEWTVNIRGTVLQIVDSSGRERHKSRGHILTGTCLAMRLADTPFESTPNLDEALRRSAAKFIDG